MKKRICLLLLLLVVFVSGCAEKVPPPRDISGDSPLAPSIVYANGIANKVQGYYNERNRDQYVLENTTMRLYAELNAKDKKQVSAIETLDGKVYLQNTMDAFIEDTDGTRYYASQNANSGRVNTLRLGYYYYDAHVYDMTFGNSGISPNKINTVALTNFQEEDMQISSGKIEYQKNEAAFYVPAGEKISISRTGLSVDLKKYQGIIVHFTGESEVVATLKLEIDGKIDENSPEITVESGVPVDVSRVAETGKITGFRLTFTSETAQKITLWKIQGSPLVLNSRAIYFDRNFHAYSDKMHQQLRMISPEPLMNLATFGMEVRIPKKTVAATSVKEGYIAFDIKKVGVIGFIFPADDSVEVLLKEEGDAYVLTQKISLPKCTAANFEANIGTRIYNDTTHSFAGIEQAALVERNPIKIEIEGENGDHAAFLQYDSLRGAYQFTMDGTDFNEAFYNTPNKYYEAAVKLLNDANDRQVYIWMNTPNGCLESAALLDERETLVPIPLQVGKNFAYEKEEPIYIRNDDFYGDTLFPLQLKKNETCRFKLLNLYQNWGKYPLKQLSSIQFFVSYYHLSTGATETNCIAPYYVHNDGWVLPDFRCRSGVMWAGQPQFNSIGNLFFVRELANFPEYTESQIHSAGPTYADLDYSYVDAEGNYKVTLRHVEFPQDDENRTYYTVTVDFLKKGSFDNSNREFYLTTFDSTNTYFSRFDYLDENNKVVTKTIEEMGGTEFIASLAEKQPYIGAYAISSSGAEIYGSNVSYLVKNASGTLNGKKWDGKLSVKAGAYAVGSSMFYSLSPNMDTIKFKKGDQLVLDVILLPWGGINDKDNHGAEAVRKDSILNPITITPVKGTVIPDAWLPRISCVDNAAEFTVAGSNNNNAVRIDGFTKLGQPVIEEKVDGKWVEYSPYTTGYDGYSVFYNPDGTYSYSFVYRMDGAGQSRTFRVGMH